MTQLTGTVIEGFDAHTPESLQASFDEALVVLAMGGRIFKGRMRELPEIVPARPVVLMAHGSSGINAAVEALGEHLARRGWALVAPDSMAAAGRLAYTSPVDAGVYERIHAMRLAELQYAAQRLPACTFFNGFYVVAGTSEGGVAAARFDSAAAPMAEAARMIFSWSCEDNYFVKAHATNIPPERPVLNIMSADDKYFGRSSPYLGNPHAEGHAARALAASRDASVVLLPGAPHTLFNEPAAQSLIDAFLERVLAAA